MPKVNLTTIDVIVMAIYVVVLIAWGLYHSKRKSAEDYFLGGRGMAWWLVGLSMFSTVVSSSSLVGWSGDAYSTGISVFNYGISAAILPIIFVLVFFLPFYLRNKIYTLPEFLEGRYDQCSRYYLSVISILAYTFLDSAVTLYAGALMVKMIFPSASLTTLVWILAIVAASYTLVGGLSAVMYADILQAAVLFVGSVVLTLTAFSKAGGWDAVMQAMPAGHLSLIRPANDPSVPWPALIISVPLLGFYYWGTSQAKVLWQKRDFINRHDPKGRTKPFFMGEIGMNRRGPVEPQGGEDSHPKVYEHIYGVWMADFNVQAARAGMQGSIAWMLDDAMHINKDKDTQWPDLKQTLFKKWGFWNSLAEEIGHPEDAKLRPWYYTWSLMSRYFPRGCTIIRTRNAEMKGIRTLAAKTGDDGFTFCVVNDSDTAQQALLRAPAFGRPLGLCRYLYAPDDRAVDANGFPVPKKALKQADLATGLSLALPARSVVLLTTMEEAVQTRHNKGWGTQLAAGLLACSFAAVFVSANAAPPQTFCNPLNLDYGWSARGYRHSADPVIVLFKDRYYLFATDDVPGYRVSDDLLSWTNIVFAPELRPLMSDNDRGSYCAPAVAADESHVYFIRMDRRKESKTVPVMRSADPASGRWEKCGELRKTGDPALFFDDGRAWLYHGLNQPTKVFEIARKTWTEIPGSERQLRPAITNLADLFGGYERGRRELLGEEDTGAWLNKFTILPCQEAAWMTKHDGRYYLQYATPGTVTEWYCDTVMEGGSVTGPFRHVDYAPTSLKVGGFMGSAGHSCVFQDRHGNHWRVTTMWVGVHDLFERRLGLFPVGFDADGRMFTETMLGDYPQVMPAKRRDAKDSPLAGWLVQSFGRPCTASSSLTNHTPALAADEDCRTWWSAQTGNAGEWLQMDLGKPTRVDAVQVNFAEQDCVAKSVLPSGEFQRYKLLASDDGQQWRPLFAPGARLELPGSVREAIGPHDYLAFSELPPLRFLRVENVFTPAQGKFALRDLRVFGRGTGQPPLPVSGLKVVRHSDDDRNATVSWTPSPSADGYLIRFGVAPDKLFQVIQLQCGTNASLTTHALNRGIKYSWRVDAFNSTGLTPGRAGDVR